jgi:predicted RNA binding protein YcfA (HicA-like mRNA interferase family)
LRRCMSQVVARSATAKWVGEFAARKMATPARSRSLRRDRDARRGWKLLLISGSHHIYSKPGSVVRLSIPIHGNRPLKIGLLRHLANAFTIDLFDPPGCMELIPLRMQFPGRRGACPANRPADHSALPSTQADSFRPDWEAPTADPMAGSRASSRRWGNGPAARYPIYELDSQRVWRPMRLFPRPRYTARSSWRSRRRRRSAGR